MAERKRPWNEPELGQQYFGFLADVDKPDVWEKVQDNFIRHTVEDIEQWDLGNFKDWMSSMWCPSSFDNLVFRALQLQGLAKSDTFRAYEKWLHEHGMLTDVLWHWCEDRA